MVSLLIAEIGDWYGFPGTTDAMTHERGQETWT